MTMYRIVYVHYKDEPSKRTQITFATKEQYKAELDRIWSLGTVHPGKGRTLTGCHGIGGDFVALQFDPEFLD